MKWPASSAKRYGRVFEPSSATASDRRFWERGSTVHSSWGRACSCFLSVSQQSQRLELGALVWLGWCRAGNPLCPSPAMQSLMQAATPSQLPPALLFSMMPYDLEYPFGQLGVSCLGCAPSHLLVHPQPSRWPGKEPEKSLT